MLITSVVRASLREFRARPVLKRTCQCVIYGLSLPEGTNFSNLCPQQLSKHGQPQFHLIYPEK